MPKDVVSLKIDFKIDECGILRIIDLGDGMGADMKGFEDKPIDALILRDMHEATGATLVSLFGELPYDAMQPESINIPLLLRPLSVPHQSSLHADALSSVSARLLLCCDRGRLTSYASYVLGKQLDTVAAVPIALMSVEMHKVLWYFLMEKLMQPEAQQQVAYWSNDTDPTGMDLSVIDFHHGAFIKIGDRSDGGGSEVYYAKNADAVLKRLNSLYKKYHLSEEAFKKHLFIIEPAYMTLKEYKRKHYNVTGRAFFTLIYDKLEQTLDVKIAGAKWMFPLLPLESEHLTQDQMLSNIKHSITMLDLDATELGVLSSGIVGLYGATFKAGFEHDNLMDYCIDNPQMAAFISCLRPNASYKLFLQTDPHHVDGEDIKQLLAVQMYALFSRDSFGLCKALLKAYASVSFSLFEQSSTLTDKMKHICFLSCVESYIAFLKSGPAYPFIHEIIAQEASVKSVLNRLIEQYLAESNASYDRKDLNRALRQAAFTSDVVVMKLLIYTRRADVNAFNAKYETALTYARRSTHVNKEQGLCLLEQVGASIVQPQAQNNVPAGR